MFFMCFAAFAGNLSKLPFFFSVASRMQIFPDEKIEALSSPAPVPAAAPPAENTAKQGAEAASETSSPEAATENKKAPEETAPSRAEKQSNSSGEDSAK